MTYPVIIEADNPSLNLRHWVGKTPVPVVIGHRNNLSSKELTLMGGQTTVNFYPSPVSAVEGLYEDGIQSALVEGGRQTLQGFIDSGIWDEAYVETSNVKIHSGLHAPIISNAILCSSTDYDGNTVVKYKNCNPTSL